MRIKLKEITWDRNKIIKIVEMTSTAPFANKLTLTAETILNQSKNKIAYNTRRKKRGKHLRDAYTVRKPKNRRVRVGRDLFRTKMVLITPPNRFFPYAGVMAAGHRKGKPLNYKTGSAMKDPFKTSLDVEQSKLMSWFKQEAQRIAGKIDKE